MKDPAEVLSAYVASLKLVPELVTLLGGSASNIVGYSEAGCYAAYLEKLLSEKPKLIVAWISTELNQRYDHTFQITYVGNSSPSAIMLAIQDGKTVTPGEDGGPDITSALTMRQTEVVAECFPPSFKSFRRVSLPQQTFDCWEMFVTFTSKTMAK